MAALVADFNVPSVALAAATAKTVARVTAAANQRVKLIGYGLYFDGVTQSNTPVQIRITRSSAAGTDTPNTGVPSEPELTETVQTTGGVNSTVEPATPTAIKTISVSPFGGMYEYLAPFGQEEIIGGGKTLNIECTAAQVVNVRGYIRIEE